MTHRLTPGNSSNTMDAPPPPQPDAAAAAPSSTSASAPPSAPPPNLTPSVPVAAPPTSDSTPAPTPNPGPAPAPAPAQTLESPTPSPASARPPPPRMRPPYTHLASPITMSSSSSPATAAAASSAISAIPRGGVAIGLPAHPRGVQTPVGYTGFVPPPPLAHQFSSMHRGPDQPTLPNPQLRQPAPGIQNIGMIGSLNTTQMRPGAISGPQQPRPGVPSSTTPSLSGSQMPGSQKTPTHALTRPLSTSSPSTALQQTPPNVPSSFRPQQRPQVPQPRPYHVAQSAPAASHQQNALSGQQQLPQHHLLQQQQQSQPQHSSPQNQQNTTLKGQQQAARTPVSLAQKPDSPAILQATNMQLVDMVSTDAAAGESSNRLLSKRSIHELVAQIDPSENLDPEVEDILVDIGEDFIESQSIESLTLWNQKMYCSMQREASPCQASLEIIKLYKKPHVNDIHRERLTLIKKSMASEGNTKSSAAQAAANQKNQTPKQPTTGSP